MANPGFDYNTVQSYSIPVTVTDSRGLQDTQTLTVLIDNTNYPPVFDTPMTVVPITEEQVTVPYNQQ